MMPLFHIGASRVQQCHSLLLVLVTGTCSVLQERFKNWENKEGCLTKRYLVLNLTLSTFGLFSFQRKVRFLVRIGKKKALCFTFEYLPLAALILNLLLMPSRCMQKWQHCWLEVCSERTGGTHLTGLAVSRSWVLLHERQTSLVCRELATQKRLCSTGRRDWNKIFKSRT